MSKSNIERRLERLEARFAPPRPFWVTVSLWDDATDGRTFFHVDEASGRTVESRTAIKPGQPGFKEINKTAKVEIPVVGRSSYLEGYEIPVKGEGVLRS